jgi:predicted metallopeptidase
MWTKCIIIVPVIFIEIHNNQFEKVTQKEKIKLVKSNVEAV